MIIARGKSDSDDVLLIGLSSLNVARLIQGHPIVITKRTYGDGIPDGWIISIVHGETEQDMVHINPKLK